MLFLPNLIENCLIINLGNRHFWNVQSRSTSDHEVTFAWPWPWPFELSKVDWVLAALSLLLTLNYCKFFFPNFLCIIHWFFLSSSNDKKNFLLDARLLCHNASVWLNSYTKRHVIRILVAYYPQVLGCASVWCAHYQGGRSGFCSSSNEGFLQTGNKQMRLGK